MELFGDLFPACLYRLLGAILNHSVVDGRAGSEIASKTVVAIGSRNGNTPRPNILTEEKN